MNNVASPTVSGPVTNLQGLNPLTFTTELPKVTCVADAKQYPGRNGTEDVLLDQNDPEIAYFRKIDTNGFIQVDRRRCLAEPEPTQEELNDKRYLSREEFAAFMDQFKSFREEMSENVRVLTAATKSGDTYNRNTSSKQRSYDSKSPANQNTAAGTQTVQ